MVEWWSASGLAVESWWCGSIVVVIVCLLWRSSDCVEVIMMWFW